jgi:hypothetical protein
MLYLPSAALIADRINVAGYFFRFGGDDNLNVGALFETHLVAVSVSQGIFNT